MYTVIVNISFALNIDRIIPCCHWHTWLKPPGGHLVLTLPGCVCPKVKDMGPFSASREWNEWEYFTQNGYRICRVTQYGREFMLSIVYNYIRKQWEWAKIIINYTKWFRWGNCEWTLWMIHFSLIYLILHHNMGMNCVEDPFNMGLFFTQGVLHYGYIFRPPTHTSGHFILKSPPPPPGLNHLERVCV